MTSFPFIPFPSSISSHDPVKFLAPSSLVSVHKHKKKKPNQGDSNVKTLLNSTCILQLLGPCSGDKCIVQVLLDLAARDFFCSF